MSRLTGTALLLTTITVNAAVSTWNGSATTAWTNAINWSFGVPAVGDDVVIADSTGSGNTLSLSDSRTIGNFQFGTAGNRTTTFQILNTNGPTTSTLTFTNGFLANGSAGALATVEMFHVPITIANDQTWNVGGSPGNATTDAGIRLRERTTGNPTVLTLNGTLFKTGPGQLSFVGQTVGNGNVVVNQGSLKLNAGGTTLLTLNGTGSITVNNGGSLMISRNSGTWNFTKAVVLNSGSTIQFGGGTATSLYPFPVTWNGNVTLSAVATGTELNILSGAWSGNASINMAQAGAQQVSLILSNDISGLSGSLNHAANLVRLDFAAPCPGNANMAWSLNNAGAIMETLGAANINLGSLAGASGTLRNSDPTANPATVTVGQLNTDTTFGGVLADNTGTLGLVKVGTGTLTLTGVNTLTGGITVNNGTVFLQGAAASVGGGSVTVHSGAAFGGSGNANGAVTVLNGGTIRADGGAGSPPLNVGTLTLGSGATDITTSSINLYPGGKIANTGTLTVNGTNIVNIIGAAPPAGIYDLITYAGLSGAGFAGFQLGALPFGVVAHLQDSGTVVQLNITAVTIEPGVWVGNVLGQWNLAGGLEWKGATSGNPQSYHDLDVVTFDDSASNFTVNVTANVSPTIAHINNTASYTFTGVAGISGVGLVTKDGPGDLLFLNNNTYSGGTFITNGSLSLGNGGTSGSIVGPVMNAGALVANRSDTNSLPGPISGGGTIEQRGTGTLILGGANTYTGLTTVAFGTLATASGTALGDPSVGTVIAAGATLDVNAQALGNEPISVSGAGVGGNGAIVNNGTADQQNATRFVTLTGPTTFGGAFRWDIRNPTPGSDPTGGNLAALVGNNNDLTKVSSNVIAFISAGDTGLRDINIRAGTLTFSRSTTLGDPARTVTVYPGATLQFHRTSEFENNVINKVTVMTNATLAVETSGLTNQVASPITISGSNVVSLPSADGINFQGSISGNGSITAASAGALIISGNCTYTGGTTVGGGFLQVDGSLGTGGHPLAITGPTVIGGNGTILDPIGTLPAGSTLAPGDSVGALTLSGALVMAPGSSNVFEINKDLGTNDVLKGLTSVTYGGTLVLNNVGSTIYAPGDSFKLYYAGSYGGSFAAIAPAVPALGLVWVTNTLPTSGTIGVALLPNPIPLIVNSASSLVSNSVNVLFSSVLEQSSAEDPTNYKLSTGNPSVLSATLISPTNVLLALDAPITNAAFTVNVKNVHDQAYVPNVVATTNAPGIALGFFDAIPVLATNGSAFAYGTNGLIKIYSDGADIFNAQDTFEFVYGYVTNDFDIAVMIQSLAITDPAAKAGLMAREIDNPASPVYDDRFFMSAAFTTDPTRNNNFVQYRESQGATAIAPAAPRPPATYPTNWLRLKRTGPVFQGFCGSNGLDWTPMSAVDSSTNAPGPYPDVLRVGLAVTAHNAALTTEAIFSNYGKAVERGNLSFAVSGNFLIVSWQASLIGATLQTTSDVTPPSTWNPVAGSTTTNLVYIPIGANPAFFRLKN